MYQKIFDPKTNKYISSDSKRGKRVIHKYLEKVNDLSGGTESDTADLCNGCGERIVIGDGVSVIIESRGLRELENRLEEAKRLPGANSYPDEVPYKTDGGVHKWLKDDDNENYRKWKHRQDAIEECTGDISKLRETLEIVQYVLEDPKHMVDLEYYNQELQDRLDSTPGYHPSGLATRVHDQRHEGTYRHDGRTAGEGTYRHDGRTAGEGYYSDDDY